MARPIWETVYKYYFNPNFWKFISVSSQKIYSGFFYYNFCIVLFWSFYLLCFLTFHKSLLRHWFKCIFVSTCFHILTLTHTLHGFSFSAHVHHYCWYQNYWFKNRMLYSSQLKHCFLVLSLVSCDGYNILFVRM